MQEIYSQLFAELRSEYNPENAGPMSHYMRDLFPFLGIKSPKRKEIAKKYFKMLSIEKTDWDFVNQCWAMEEREFQYLALDYLSYFHKCLGKGDLAKLKEISVVKSWWDTIDYINIFIGEIVSKHPELKDTMILWSKDENFWLRRLAIDFQLKFRKKTDTKLLSEIISNNFHSTEFFINKAIGWSLREYSKTDPAWVKDFIAANREKMSPLSVREASKYLK